MILRFDKLTSGMKTQIPVTFSVGPVQVANLLVAAVVDGRVPVTPGRTRPGNLTRAEVGSVVRATLKAGGLYAADGEFWSSLSADVRVVLVRWADDQLAMQYPEIRGEELLDWAERMGRVATD